MGLNPRFMIKSDLSQEQVILPTLITLLRIPSLRPNPQYKASTAKMAQVRYC